MSFDAHKVSLQFIRSLRIPLQKLRRRNPKLFEQLRDAGASGHLNLSEGRRRMGRDRTQLWRISAGSADEAMNALMVAEALGDLNSSDVKEALEYGDRFLAIMWRLTEG